MAEHVELNKVLILIREQCVRKTPPVPVSKRIHKVARSNQKKQGKLKAVQDTNVLQKVRATKMPLVEQVMRNKRQEKLTLTNIFEVYFAVHI